MDVLREPVRSYLCYYYSHDIGISFLKFPVATTWFCACVFLWSSFQELFWRVAFNSNYAITDCTFALWFCCIATSRTEQRPHKKTMLLIKLVRSFTWPLKLGAWPGRTAHINGVPRNFFPALASSPEDVRIPVSSQVRVWFPTCLHLLPLFSGWALTVLPAAQSNRWTKRTGSSVFITRFLLPVKFWVFWNVNLLILECAFFFLLV